ncbi:hypothetical protein QQ045_020971 [Rhodiola kirilowii]
MGVLVENHGEVVDDIEHSDESVSFVSDGTNIFCNANQIKMGLVGVWDCDVIIYEVKLFLAFVTGKWINEDKQWLVN